MDRGEERRGSPGDSDGRERRRRGSVTPRSFLIRDILGECAGGSVETDPAGAASSGNSQLTAAAENTLRDPSTSLSESRVFPNRNRDVPPECVVRTRYPSIPAETTLQSVSTLTRSPAGGSVFSDGVSTREPRLGAVEGSVDRPQPEVDRREWFSGREPAAPLLPWPGPLLYAPHLYLERWQGVLQTRLRDCRHSPPPNRSGGRLLTGPGGSM